MDKQIARYSYWIGLACVAITVVWRALMQVWPGIPGTLGAVWYSSFWKAGVVLLVVSIASVNYAWLRQEATQGRAEKTTARAA